MDWDQGVIAKHLFLQSQQYEMPEFQRPYSWAADDWRTLWVDVLRQYRENHIAWSTTSSPAERGAKLKHVATHYLGVLVTSDPLTVTPPRSKVVDGQQRLMTAMVLLLAACCPRLPTSADRLCRVESRRVERGENRLRVVRAESRAVRPGVVAADPARD